jgi:hypothetical protein
MWQWIWKYSHVWNPILAGPTKTVDRTGTPFGGSPLYRWKQLMSPIELAEFCWAGSTKVGGELKLGDSCWRRWLYLVAVLKLGFFSKRP